MAKSQNYHRDELMKKYSNLPVNGPIRHNADVRATTGREN